MGATTGGPGVKKVALVIGAGDATGSAIARRFAREGYVACMTRRSADKLQPLVEEIRAAGGEAHGFASDARKEEQVAELVEHIESQVGLIDISCSTSAQTCPQHPGTRLPASFQSGRWPVFGF
jgi:NAD(P)-dependent dehydrogenase (short-subunit alcohol dehydrogenase family)